MQRRNHSHVGWIEALLLVALGVVAPFAFFLAQRPSIDPTNGVAVIFAPWLSASEAADRATAAGARLLSSGGFDFVLIVKPETPSYVDAVRAAGALLVLDASSIPLCSPQRPVT